ncbi:ADP-heptose--lipooligosaccharide heptosyltransferase II [hydrothermal vent metagenome]|uniref:ADP-heptose--lipooligosaccharide heptosyltransferase II n=1 Tax=hydrothermal vent metagenome TaxID=652676 RepID=A0A3B1BP78_9ZZZZ
MNDKPGARPESRILVVRTDRVGDVVLSLPVFASLRSAMPDAYICALTRDYTRDLLTERDDVNEVISFKSKTSHIPLKEFPRILHEVKLKDFDVAIVLYSNFSVSALTMMAGIPKRIGPATKLAQIFLTHRIIQRRSKGKKHEADHNLDLLWPLDISPLRKIKIAVQNKTEQIFSRNENKPLIGVHPGSGGSARNWPEQKYVELINELSLAGADVVITGSPQERRMVERIAQEVDPAVTTYIGEDGLKGLISALAEFDVFIAPSTGPLHIASAVGTPVVGIYCPISVCLPSRWGPIGAHDTALVPNVTECKTCIEEECEEWDCMYKIEVSLVRDSALAKVSSQTTL